MTLKSLKLLHSSEGQELLAKYRDIPEKELWTLALSLNKKNIPEAAELVTMLKCRQKAQEKFSKAHDMFFTTEALEQASGESIAQYIAERFSQVLPRGSDIMDLTCGIGGNAIFLARYFQVKAVDHNEIHLTCAQYNSEVYGVSKSIEFILGRAEDNIQSTAAFFIDPQRTREGKTKTRFLTNSSPNILTLLPELLKVTQNICIKISPAFDYSELQELPMMPEVEIIFEKNTNKAALLWFGKFKTYERRATTLSPEQVVSFTNQQMTNEVPISTKPLAYIYEPNKSITKAHLVNEVANQYGLQKINSQIAFLTSNRLLKNVQDIFRIFRVISVQPFSLKTLKHDLVDKGIERAHIIARRFPQTPDEMKAKLKLKEDQEHVVILTVLADEKRYFILAKVIQ